MKKIFTVLYFIVLAVIIWLILATNAFAQDTTYVYKQTSLIRIDNLGSEPNSLFLPIGQTSMRIRGNDFVLKDNISRQEYNIGDYTEIFDNDTNSFATQEALITYLANIINNQGSLDNSTLSMQTIEYEHHEIHAGSHFFYEDTTSLDLNDTLYIGLQTANTTKWVHIVWVIASQKQIQTDIFRGSTVTWNGTELTPENNNQNSTNTSNLVEFEKNPTIGDLGTKLPAEAILGTATNPNVGLPGEGSRDRELILKQNEVYLLRIISGVNTNIVTWLAEWYEHTDKL